MATANRIRALNRLPFDFQDGLKVGGVDVTNLNQAFTPAGAGLIGFTPVGNLSAGNVQSAIAELDTEKVGKSELADTEGAALVGYDSINARTVFDNARPIADYTALRAYAGRAAQVRITSTGIAGFFYYDASDTTSLDNGGTIIVSSNGRRWKRLYEGAVNVFWFMTPGQIADVKSNTASIDVTSAIQAAVDYAVSSGLQTVYAPAGSYKITATVNVGRITFVGAGMDATVFFSYITNGTSVLKFSNIYFGLIEKFRVTTATFDTNGFIAGTSNGQNCIGVEFDSAGSDFSRNFVIRDVMCYGLKTGYRIDGFIGNTENCCAWWCETGLNGNLLNSVTLNLNFEGCRKDFEVVNSTGLLFNRCIFEGAALASGLVASTVDDCQGVTFNSLYLEQNRNTPFIVVGGTTLVTDVNVFGASIATQPLATSAYNLDIPLIKFDKVDGLRVDASISPGFLRSLYEVTPNTKNFFDFSVPRYGGQTSVLDNSNTLLAVKNYFPNPNFDLWFRGWPGAGATGCSLSKETSVVRSGKNAAKVTRTAGATGTGFVYFSFSDEYLASVLAGKTITLYAWIYIPNIAEFDPNYTSGGSQKRTAFPYIGINVNGTGGSTATASTSGGRRGGWNLQRITINVPSDCTAITVYLNIQTPAPATGNEYIICDSIYIVEGGYAHTAKVANGQVTDSEVIQSRGLVGKLVSRSSAAPVSTFQSYEVGDEVLNIAPAAGGNIGWVCTAAGSPGTWKTFGAIAA